METECLIIGTGFAGLEAAMHLRNTSAQAAITLANPEPHLIYKPWLVYLPAQRKRFDQCLLPLEPVAEQYHLRLLVDTITMLSPEEHQVQLASGERLHYAQVVIATGSTARREAIPGAKTHALFPCDVEDAHRLRERFLALWQGTVTVIIAGPRPGPGLEYAGWMARYVQERQRTSSIRIQLIDAQPRLMAHLGERAASLLEQIMSKLGIRLLTGQPVEEIAEQEIRLKSGKRVVSHLTAVVGSLRGVDLGLTAPVVDEQGFVPVNTCFQSPSHPDLFAVGDAAALGRRDSQNGGDGPQAGKIRCPQRPCSGKWPTAASVPLGTPAHELVYRHARCRGSDRLGQARGTGAALRVLAISLAQPVGPLVFQETPLPMEETKAR
jgi:NADH:ubiquinone reductase (H+-translocating)